MSFEGQNFESSRGERELWKNKEVLTVSIKRHGRWDAKDERVPKGALTPDAIKETRKLAEEWAKGLPEGAEVKIYESPSYMPAKSKRGEEVLPRRASITASIYEKAVFGDLAKTKVSDEGVRESTRREREPYLGDFFEHVESAEQGKNIPAFYKLKAEIYGKDQERFWADFVSNQLPKELHDALIAAGGTDGIGLARNFVNFLESASKKKNENKNVVLAVTHGETLESFLYQTERFLGENNMHANLPDSIGYNEGVDFHQEGDSLNICSNGKCFTVKMSEIKAYITDEEGNE